MTIRKALLIIVVVFALLFTWLSTWSHVESEGKDLINEDMIQHLVPDFAYCFYYSEHGTFEGISVDEHFEDGILKYGFNVYDVSLGRADKFGYHLEFRLRTNLRWAVPKSGETFRAGRIHADPKAEWTNGPYPGRFVLKKNFLPHGELVYDTRREVE